jgi:hypothetical protein
VLPVLIPTLPEKYILASIKFKNDPANNYYVTTRLNVVRLKNNELEVIGKFARVNDEDFPYMIYDANNNRIYIDSFGDLYNSKGSTVGKLKIYTS